jgi:apolipoprotein N-acyltransferase
MRGIAITSTIAALAACVASAAAAVAPQPRDVWAPQILYPHASTVWYKRGPIPTPTSPRTYLRLQTHNIT